MKSAGTRRRRFKRRTTKLIDPANVYPPDVDDNDWDKWQPGRFYLLVTLFNTLQRRRNIRIGLASNTDHIQVNINTTPVTAVRWQVFDSYEKHRCLSFQECLVALQSGDVLDLQPPVGGWIPEP